MSTPQPAQRATPAGNVIAAVPDLPEHVDDAEFVDQAPVDPSRVERIRRIKSRLLPVVLGATIAVGAGVYGGIKLFGGSRSGPIDPTLQQVMDGANGLNHSTPTLNEEQVAGWPVQETVTVTSQQAADGPDAIVGAIDPEVFSGSQQNTKTQAALEAQVDAQTAFGQGAIIAGRTFTVADIHPHEANAVTGGNNDIPNS